MQERRISPRFPSNLDARWETLMHHGRASVSDLSETGCFVLGATKTTPGELIRLEIRFPKHPVFLWGQVVYCVEEMGFAVRFLFGEDNEMRSLRNLIDNLRQSFDTPNSLS